MTFISYAQNFEDVMLRRAFRGVDRGFYIDVGAYDPHIDSVTRAFYEIGWHGINLEPVAEAHRHIALYRPRDINLNVAAGERAGELTFHTIAETGLSTLDPALAERHLASGFHTARAVAQVQTLAEICAAHAPPDIHFLKVDCEGSERAALAGADFARFRPRIVLVEATEPNTQRPSHAEWEPILLAAGYVFAWFDGLNRFYVADEHGAALLPRFSTPPNVFDDFRRDIDRPSRQEILARGTALESITPAMTDLEARITMATRCRDADPIPKVAAAGEVQTGPDGTRVQIMHNGIRVPADGYYGEWMTRLIGLCRGHHEPQEERMFDAVMPHLADDATMIELGGFWCYYTTWFLRDRPSRRAVVVEPEPLHRAVGERTLALNGCRAVFVDAFVGASATPPLPFATEKSGVIPLPRVAVPDLMREHGFTTLDVLHCDTQGAELAVLESCCELLAQGRIRWLFVSTHALQITGDPLTHQRCLDVLRRCGATIEAEHDVHESFSGDGLIVARFVPAPDGWQPIHLTHNRYGDSLFRNPAYDLAAAMTGRRNALPIDRVIRAMYEKLLLRPPDATGWQAFSEGLPQSQDPAWPLDAILTGPEFRMLVPRFLERHVPGAIAAAENRNPWPAPTDALACSGLRFSLTRDGALGQKDEVVMLPTDNVMLPGVLQQGAWNRPLTDFVAGGVAADDTYLLLDIGANVGMFSRQLLTARRQIATCICVEPDPRNHALLVQNLAHFTDRSIRTFNVALSDTDGEVAFLRDLENAGNYSLNEDAMRERPHELITVRAAAVATWMRDTIGGDTPIIWKSDTQGHDVLIVAETPWEVWDRVRIAVIELWRIRGDGRGRAAFLEKIDRFPNKRLGLARPVTTGEVADYVEGDDWEHDDLILWR